MVETDTARQLIIATHNNHTIACTDQHLERVHQMQQINQRVSKSSIPICGD